MLLRLALRLVRVGFAVAVLAPPAGAADLQLHRIGVLAYRPKPAVLAAFQPTAEYLSRSLPGHRFDIVPLDLGEVERAIAGREVDFVYTNPEQYIVLEAHHRVTRIATVVQDSAGRPLQRFGGVILVRTGRDDLKSLADLRGKTLAGVAATAFGGYLMQAGELLDIGLDVRRQARLEFLGLPQDRIVQAVAEGRVDAGFVRTGVLEAMAADGRIRLEDFRVLNSRAEDGFPFLLSTRLYPEWPFASTPHTPEALAKQVLVALLALPAGSEPARRGGYHSWAIPLSYESVHLLMKSLRVAPYDVPPAFSLREVLRRYESEIFVLLSLGLLAMFVAAWRFRRLNGRLAGQMSLAADRSRELEREVQVRQRTEQRLAAENQVLDLLAVASPLPVVLAQLMDMHQAELPGQPVAILQFRGGGDGPQIAMQANLDEAVTRTLAERGVAGVIALHPDYAAEPLRDPAGRELGYLLTAARGMGERRAFLRNLASLAALAIEQAQAAERLRLNASVFENALEGIVVTDPDGTILEVNDAFTALTGYAREEAIGNNPRVLKSGLHEDAFYRRMWQALTGRGQWQGEIWNRRKDGTLMAEILHVAGVKDGAGRTTHYVGTFSDITALKETQARLEHAATFDGLTGLPNRTLLTDRLRQAQSHTRRRGTLLAICFLDLDNFKPVNDTLGHDAGDTLLREVSRRLDAALRAGDTVARLGGDEFVLLLSDLSGRGEVSQTLERLLAKLAEPYPVADTSVTISASIGVTLYPQDDADPDALLRHADQAMYRAKQQGRNRFHLFDTAADEQMQQAVVRQQRLRQALEQDELRLHYQPKIHLRSGRLVGVEALLRWAHPTEGLLPPAAFLPAVEHHDLICDIGEWVVAEALHQQAAWAMAGLTVPISVNIAAHHFLKPGFAGRLERLLGAHPERPRHSLELEILETAAFADLEAMVAVVKECRALGVRVALDDFGTGYSSLSYLKLLPADTLKIDRSFVFDMLLDRQSLAIVEGIVSLASAFQREIVAEGVETTEHGTTLLRLGCELAQGYGIGRPMPGERIPAWAAGFTLPEEWRFWSEASWDLRDFPLLVAEVDHRHWVEAIIAAATGDEPLGGATGSLDQCGFGLWLSRHGRARYGRQGEFPKVEARHRDLHQIAHRIVDCLDDGREHDAHRLVRPLREASDRLLATLARLQRGSAVEPAAPP